MSESTNPQPLGTARSASAPALTVSALGLGCMGMSEFYGTTDESEAVTTIHRALDLGVTFLDTADMYGPFTNERLVGGAIADRRDSVVLATKFGNQRGEDGSRPASTAGPSTSTRPATRACSGSASTTSTSTTSTASTRRSPSRRPSARWPSWSRPARCASSGSSEASAETIRRAHAVHPITALQTEYSLFTRDVETEILPPLRELGIGLVPYSPLGRGFLTGAITSPDRPRGRRLPPAQPALPGRRPGRQPRAGRGGPRARRAPRARRRAARAGVGAGPGRRRGADPGHQAGALPRGERRRCRGDADRGRSRRPRLAPCRPTRSRASATRTCPASTPELPPPESQGSSASTWSRSLRRSSPRTI